MAEEQPQDEPAEAPQEQQEDIYAMSGQQEQGAYQDDTLLRLRDLEDQQRILKDRIVLVGETLIEERSRNVADIQQMKKTVLTLKEENDRVKAVLQRITELLPSLSRKEELAIVQRQLEIVRN
jgi:hypothetical protein